MILLLFIMYKKKNTFILLCALSTINLHLASAKCDVETSSYLTIRLFMLPIARSNDTHWLKWKIVSTLIATNLDSPSATRWKPHLWPNSSQQSTLVPKIGLGGKEKQQWCHVPCTTDVWKGRGPLAQALCNRWFASSLSCKSKCQTWPPMEGSMLLCHWMHPNTNATWRSLWPWLPQWLWHDNTCTRLLPQHCNQIDCSNQL